MQMRRIVEGVEWLGVIDWDRRLFDALVPLPDGTSYNAFLVRGGRATALIDTADPSGADLFHDQLAGIDRIDWLVANHAEPDHAGLIPSVLARHPETTVLTTPKGAEMLAVRFGLDAARVRTVADGERIDLGGRTLEFVHAPWVHWPETMLTWLPEDGILFSCDLFGSHLATSDLFATDLARVFDAARRYYAEIMMPFRAIIRRHIERVEGLHPRLIAPSHGPLHDQPSFILEAYRSWTAEAPENLAVVLYASMHGATARMVGYLVAELALRRIPVRQFDMTVSDIGKVAESLVDAATIVLGSPTVLGGAHPAVAQAAFLANMLRPKARTAAVVGSYGWGGRVVEQLTGLMPALKLEMLPPVLTRGWPQTADFSRLAELADALAARHRGLRTTTVSVTTCECAEN